MNPPPGALTQAHKPQPTQLTSQRNYAQQYAQQDALAQQHALTQQQVTNAPLFVPTRLRDGLWSGLRFAFEERLESMRVRDLPRKIAAQMFLGGMTYDCGAGGIHDDAAEGVA